MSAEGTKRSWIVCWAILIVVVVGGSVAVLCQDSADATANCGMVRETFDGGVPDGWSLDGGWSVIQEPDGNSVLYGAGLWQWAVPDYGLDEGWTDYTLRFRMKLISGGMQVECRLNFEEGRTRYMIGFREDDTWFAKEYPNNTYNDVCDVSPPAVLTLGEWHDVEITLAGARVTVLVDGVLWFDRTDASDPLLQGTVGFETVDDPPGSGSGGSSVYIDDVEVICDSAASSEVYNEPVDGFLSSGWDLGPEWEQTHLPGIGSVLLGASGSEWGNFASNPEMLCDTDSVLTCRIRLEYGGFQISYRINPEDGWSRRYIVWFTNNEVGISKAFASGQYETLGVASARIKENEWHTVTILGKGETLRVSVDNDLVLEAFDPLMLPKGSVALETWPDSRAAVGEISVMNLSAPSPATASTSSSLMLVNEGFSDALPEEWSFTDGWAVVQEPDGNWALYGDGIWQWAVPPGGKAWTDYTVRFRVKLISGGLKTNVRFSESPEGEWTRYGIGFREDVLWFDREYPSNEWHDLCGSPWGSFHISLGEWHDVELSVEGSHFRFVVDGEVLIDCEDPTPGPVVGTLGFETMDDPPGSTGGSHVYIDDIRVRTHSAI